MFKLDEVTKSLFQSCGFSGAGMVPSGLSCFYAKGWDLCAPTWRSQPVIQCSLTSGKGCGLERGWSLWLRTFSGEGLNWALSNDKSLNIHSWKRNLGSTLQHPLWVLNQTLVGYRCVSLFLEVKSNRLCIWGHHVLRESGEKTFLCENIK